MNNLKNNGADLSPADRKLIVEDLRIKYPAKEAALEALEKCRVDSLNAKRASHKTEPKCIFIGGESGVGKSSLIESYLNAHPRVPGEEVDTVPVLVASLPPSCTQRGAVSCMLKELGDSKAFSGELDKLKDRLHTYLCRSGVELVILDEFQHLIDTENSRVITKTADLIKSLVIAANIPFALVGMPHAELIFDVNSQLHRRFTRRISLEAFSWSNGPCELAMALKLSDQGMPFAVPAGLDHPDMVKWFYDHTDGVLGLVMAILREAAGLAIDRGADRIEWVDLFAAQRQMKARRAKNERPTKVRSRGHRGPSIAEVLHR